MLTMRESNIIYLDPRRPLEAEKSGLLYSLTAAAAEAEAVVAAISIATSLDFAFNGYKNQPLLYLKAKESLATFENGQNSRKP